MNEWPIKTIAECAIGEAYSTQIGPFGKALMADQYTESGVPVLRGVNVNQGRFHDADFVFIDNTLADRLSKFESFPGDVLLVHKGTLGQIGLMPRKRKYPRYIMGNSMMRVRCDPAKLMPEYLYYWLSSAQGQHYLFSRVSQVGVPQLQTPLSTLRQASLRVPPLSEQRAITSILGTLDDRIELCQQMNETLEAMARALFKSWFVDFDPVRAKADGSDPNLPKSIADLFPDAFDVSEFGDTPKGWQVRPIGDLATVVGGSTPSTKDESYWAGGTHCWATPKDLSVLKTPVLLDTQRKITDAGLTQIGSGLLPAGVVLMSSRAPIGYLAIAEVPVAINQGFIGMRAAPGVSNLFLLRWTEWAHDLIVSRANGSTFLEISKSNFRPIPVTNPPEKLMQAFDRATRPLYSKVIANELLARTLVQLRELLLPKLISGEVRIPDVNRILGGSL